MTAGTGPAATSTLSPASNTQGKPVHVDYMYLDEIPDAMDKMGWKVSAALMRHWFSIKPAWGMHPEQRGDKAPDPTTLPAIRINDQIIKMDWLLKFNRVEDVFEDLCQNWNSERGIDLLKKRLSKNGWSQGKAVSLGHGFRLAKELESVCQVNARQFGDYTDTLDDLYGSLFKANLKLAVVGKTSRSLFSNKDVFEIEKMGGYVRDTYDFNAGWFEDAAFGLGIWSRNRCLTKAEMAMYKTSPPTLNQVNFPGFVPARNGDFRRWQVERKEGGDFYVFSNVMWMPPNVEYVVLS